MARRVLPASNCGTLVGIWVEGILPTDTNRQLHALRWEGESSLVEYLSREDVLGENSLEDYWKSTP